VQKWPGLQGTRTSSKVPSKIFYDKSSTAKWGFDVPSGAKPFQWFKLCLLDDADLPAWVRTSQHISEAREMLRRARKTAYDVVKDYLGLLWQHALSEMRGVDGEHQIDGQPLRVVVTCPAIFTLDAQRLLREAGMAAVIAVQRGGVGTRLESFEIWPEPEAAALAIMGTYHSQPVKASNSAPSISLS
jgi:hypothetical protein